MRFAIVRAALLVFVAVSLTPGVGSAQTTLINNGLAPPEPANIVAGNYAGLNVAVRDVGCGTVPPDFDDPCAVQGNPTAVEVVSPGTGAGVIAYDTSTIAMSGGSVAGLAANDSASLSVTGGSMFSLGANGTSSVLVDGGFIQFGLAAIESSSVTMTSGGAGLIGSAGTAQVVLSGGIGIYLGTDIMFLQATDASTIMVIGGGFEVDGSPVPYGDLQALDGALTGTLANGDALNAPFMQGGFDDGFETFDGTITLVADTAIPTLSTWPRVALWLGLVAFGLASLRTANRSIA